MTMFMEMLGIGLIIPLLNLLIDENSFKNLIGFNFIKNFSYDQTLKYFLISLILIYLLKSVLVFIFNKIKYDYLFALQKKISSDFMESYLNLNFAEVLKTTSSEKIRNLNNVSIFVELLNQLLMLTTEFFLLLGIFFIVILINDVETIGIFLGIGLISYYLFKISKKSLYKYGKERNAFDKLKFQSIQENFFSIKEIKILKKESFFKNKFSKINNSYAEYSKKFEIYQIIPKITLEFIGILSLCSVIIYMINIDLNTNTILVNMGVFAAAAFKIIPSLGRVINHTQFISYYSNIVEIFDSHANKRNSNKNYEVKSKILFEKCIIFQNIKFSYANKNIINDLNLQINKNECIGIVGESGSGKTTLLNILLGLLIPDKGKIYIDDININFNDFYWGDTIGYVPQFIYLINDTIKKNIAFGIKPEEIDEKQVLSSINNSHLDNFIKDLSDGINHIIDENGKNLSGGQVQRLGIARALYYKPKILILDESTSSLDSETEESILKIIEKLKNNLTIILISHRQNPLKICDKIYKIKNKQIELTCS